MEFSLDFNYHTHTTRCGHAVGKDREYVEKAMEAGIKELGFSDHSPMLFPVEGYYSNYRMYPSDAEDYVNSVNMLRKEYEDRITIHLGYELEYFPKAFDRTVDFLGHYGFDYLILGQHYIGNEYDEGSHYSGFQTDRTDYFDRYIDQALTGLSTGRFLYIAHPDLFRYTGPDEVYIEKMTYFCNELKRLDYPLEFNLLGYGDNRHYPDKRFWNIVAQTGNKVVIGYDAHTPDSFRQKELVSSAFSCLNTLGITPLKTLKIK